MKNLTGFIALGSSVILLSSCGSNHTNNTPPVPQTIQGKVIGSHYEGAWVCVDTDSDGVCDDETVTVTDAKGSWTLSKPNNDALNVIAEIYDSAVKHTNTSISVVENPMIFVAPLQGMIDGQLFVSPVSTMVYEYMKINGVPFEAAKEAVAGEVGVSADVLLANYNVPNPSADHTTLQQRSDTETEKLGLGFEYHKNSIDFFNDGIEAGNYVIKDYAVTSGQDPDHHIKKGTVEYMDDVYNTGGGRRGELTFVLGRKGSTDVADWWKKGISSNENINNNEPNKLNFAMRGDLTVTISDKTYVFSDFYIAQGHKSFANNWWIGGRECDNEGSGGSVICNATDESGEKVKFKVSNNPDSYWFNIDSVK